MYTITPHPNGSYTVHAANRDALTRLLAGKASIQPPSPSRLISNSEAHAIAQAAGRDVPSSSIISACTRGTLRGAVKVHGRWRVPEDAFRHWAGIPNGPRPPTDEEILFGKAH